METWKSIKGYEHYSVSSIGRVINNAGKILKPQLTRKKYHKLMLWYYPNKLKKGFFIHRLVAIAFIDNPKNLPQVNHKDCNKLNNHIDNLEWCTNHENHTHARDNGLLKSLQGEEHPFATLKNQQVLEIRNAILTSAFTRKMLCEKHGVSVHIVKDIRSRKSWAHI